MMAGPCPHCASERTELRRLTCANGALQYKHQCLECGRAAGNPIPHREIAQPEAVPPFDFAIIDRRAARQTAAWQAEKDRALTARRTNYRDYLASPEWRVRRDLVLKRAGFRCEGCGQARASEVHHLSYAHMRAEFLFELVALCPACHARWHGEKDMEEAPYPVARVAR